MSKDNEEKPKETAMAKALREAAERRKKKMGETEGGFTKAVESTPIAGTN